MYTMLISVGLLVLGYLFYGKFIDGIFAPDASRPTPAYTKTDGADYIPMPTWKVFMIQFLNIAGTGPIFGAILGAKFGPSCYIWIVLGCIFGGAVHDYFSGMISVKYGGLGLPQIIGMFLGNGTRKVMLVFTVFLLIMVGAVFVYSPAVILGGMTGASSTMIWVGVIIAYYLIATLVPIDKIIGKIYPIFAFALIFMAVALFVCLLVKWPSTTPEIWDGLQNRNPAAGSLFPCLFISIACGAVSGFHATQSPMMARCIRNEKLGRPVYYGAMVLEGIIAVIWASVSSYFFYGGGNVEMGAETVTAAPAVVNVVSRSWLGHFGGLLAILGVVAAPITTGDTALRSARMIVADALNYNQKPYKNRLFIAIPLFIATGAVLWFNIAKPDGFDIIWRYFGWANQTLSIFTLWAITVFIYATTKGYRYYVALIPACFMTSVCLTFILTAKIGFNIPQTWTPYLGTGIFLAAYAIFIFVKNMILSPRKKLELGR